MKFKKMLLSVSIVSVLFSLFIFYVSQEAKARGVVGEYSDRLKENTDYVNPNAGLVIDNDGTVWNMVNDVFLRSIDRVEQVTYNTRVVASTSQGNNYTSLAASQTYKIDRFNWGWAIAVPTSAVSWDRINVRVYNPITNTQTIYVNIATGAISAPLTYPSTNYFVQDVLPGESYELKCSSIVHVVFKSTGDIATESIQVTQTR